MRRVRVVGGLSVHFAEDGDRNGGDSYSDQRTDCDDPNLVLHLTAPELDGFRPERPTWKRSPAEPPLNGGQRLPDCPSQFLHESGTCVRFTDTGAALFA